METLQPTKQNNMVAINNNYKVSKNKHTTDEDKNKQTHSQIKIHNEHLTNIIKLENKKNEHDRTQNRHEHYWKTEQYFYDRTQNRIQLNFGAPNKEVIILKTPHKKG